MCHMTELRHIRQDGISLQCLHEIHNVTQSLRQQQQTAASGLFIDQLGLYGLLGERGGASELSINPDREVRGRGRVQHSSVDSLTCSLSSHTEGGVHSCTTVAFTQKRLWLTISPTGLSNLLLV